MGIGVRQPNRADRAQLLLIIGTGLFVICAFGFILGNLSQELTSIVGAISLILTGMGSNVKRGK